MKVNSFEDSKILYTTQLWKWIRAFRAEPNVLVITPLTKLSELLSLKTSSLLRLLLNEEVNELTTKGTNYDYLNAVIAKVNTQLGAEVLTVDLNHDKLLKTIFVPNETMSIDNKLLNRYLILLDKTTTRQLQIVVAGFAIASNVNYAMLNVHQLTADLNGLVTWNNVEQLVLLDVDDGLEIVDGDKLKAWLELTTKTVLTRQNLNDYFNGKVCFESFLIEKALRRL